jgi:hypothetical protein
MLSKHSLSQSQLLECAGVVSQYIKVKQDKNINSFYCLVLVGKVSNKINQFAYKNLTICITSRSLDNALEIILYDEDFVKELLWEYSLFFSAISFSLQLLTFPNVDEYFHAPLPPNAISFYFYISGPLAFSSAHHREIKKLFVFYL